MKIFNGYILVSEITAKANKSAAWLYETKSAQIEYMGGTPVVKISSLSEKYQELAKQCQDMKTYYPYADFSREIGRTKDFMGVLADQRKQKNKPIFESKKIGRYRLLKLSEEFIELANQNLIPCKLGQKYDKEDFKAIIEMQGMKIGFY